jgi:hypothetical protein
MAQTVILRSDAQRALAQNLVSKAPPNAIVTIKEETRNADQNALFWSLLSDISRQKPGGRRHTPEQWKCLVMAACGYEVQFLQGLDGQPFPAGFRSSRLTKSQMRDLIDWTLAWGAEAGIRWSVEP